MRIIALLQEFPFPPDSGMRADISRRLKCFHSLGHEVHAISWSGGRLDPVLTHVELNEARKFCASVKVSRVDRSFRRIRNLARFPSQVAGRWPSLSERNKLLKSLRETGSYNLIWIDGVHAGAAGMFIAQRLGLPFAYRSHNVECEYLAEQARLATGKEKLSISASLIGMRRFERTLHRKAACVYEISMDDQHYWRKRGFASNEWLPMQPDPGIIASGCAPDMNRDIDLLFVGGLTSPNNIAGLEWYSKKVHSLLCSMLPDVRVVVAGRSPSNKLTMRLTDAGIEVIVDPPAPAPLFARARVMMNPFLHGSGVSVKTVDMVATGRPVVTTSKGARGLPEEVVTEMSIADTPAAFADAAARAITAARAGRGSTDRAALIERVFGRSAVARALARFEPDRLA